MSKPVTRPSTAELLVELVAAADSATEQQIRDMAIDTLHFVYSVLRVGGRLLTEMPDGKTYPVNITLTGLGASGEENNKPSL